MNFFHGTGTDLADGSLLVPGAVGGDIDPECELMRVWAATSHADAIRWAERVWRTSRLGDGSCANIYEVELFGEIEPDPNWEDGTSVIATGGRVLRRVATYATPEEATEAEARLRALDPTD